MNFAKPLEAAFRFCPRCATEADPVGEVPFRCDQCGFAFFFGPVTAVGGILQDDQGQLLLLRRARDPGKGQFGLPGGFVDRGETAEEALRREIQEEVGLEVDALTYLITLPNQYTYQGLTASVLDVFYVASVPTFEAVRLEASEVAGIWTGTPGEAELSNMAFDSNRLALINFLKQNA